MSSIGITGEESYTAANTEFSGWWRRVGATLVDSLIVGIPIAILGAVAIGGAGEGGIIAVYLTSFVIGLLYAPLMMARDGARNGQTIGKQVTSIRVIHDAGGPMTFGRGFMRDGLGKAILGIVPFYGLIDVLFPLWDGRKQAIHDKVGSTTVHRA